MRARLQSLSLIALSVFLTACGSSVDQTTKASSQCVDIPNGQYFQFVEGRLVATSAREISEQERPFETALRIGNTLQGMGYPWTRLNWDGQVATISGLALDENTRSDAFIAAKSLLETDPVAGPLVQRVINNMDVREPLEAIALRLSEELDGDGFGWLSVTMAGRVATLVGTAPTPAAKDEGYAVGRATVESDLDAGSIVNIVVDAITLDNAPPPVGTALVYLNTNPSAADCQTAFIRVMDGQQIEFEPDESIVNSASSRLLDAITGIALICEVHDIEIEGHTGLDGREGFNLDLSQRRASAVRDYLMAYGVEPDALAANGYGETRPLDLSETPQAEAKNQRIVFVVETRTN